MSITGYGVTEDWLNILVLIHVIAAIVGIGPTYFGHILLRRGQNYGQLRSSLALTKMLEKFPKILGTLAVLSGLLLAWLGGYSFGDFWIYGSIALYVIIQIIMIVIVAPLSAKLNAALGGTAEPDSQPLSAEIAAILAKVDIYYWIASALGVILFLLMFFKPTL